MLSRSMSFLLKPLKKVAKDGFEIEVKDGEIRNCCLMAASYCCDISEGKNLSAIQHGDGRPQS